MRKIDSNDLLLGKVSFAEKKLPFVYLIIKRLMDIVLSSIALLFVSPILLAFIILIKLDSKGPAIFKQVRIGLGGKPFTIYKLRGMYVDAMERFPELYDYSKKEGLDFYFHEDGDPRITKVGAFIRKSSIDELPNFVNVILGDMSLVGPRPEIPDILVLYGEHLEKYISVKPGITCISKAYQRDNADKMETLEMDLKYIDTMSLKKDITILWHTFKSVIRFRNVRA